MKFVHISFRFEYTEHIEHILDENGVSDYVRYPMVEGKGQDGKHCGNQVCPGNFTVVQAMVDDKTVDGLLGDLSSFRKRKKAHEHLRACVLGISGGVGL